jgi:hypothetical protein
VALAEVDAHLRGCAACRAEVAAARAAREALRAAPAPAPIDLTGRFAPDRLGDLAKPPERPAPRPAVAAEARRRRLLTGLAAAAVVALVALAIPQLGGGAGDDSAQQAAGPAESGEAAPAAGDDVRLTLDRTDYDEERLGEAGMAFAAADTLSEDAAAGAALERAASPARTRRALECVATAFPDYPGRVAELRFATFEGTPAYLAFVLEGVRDGTPDRYAIWVADARECSILALSSGEI